MDDFLLPFYSFDALNFMLSEGFSYLPFAAFVLGS